MHSFIVRVTAYHGEPKQINGIYVRSGTSRDHAVVDASQTPEPPVAANDASPGDIDDLVNAFQDEYGCKVGLGDAKLAGIPVFEFDIFEPSWPLQLDADEVANELAQRIIAWC